MHSTAERRRADIFKHETTGNTYYITIRTFTSCFCLCHCQNESLQAAMTALADYKKKQRGSYQFDIPLMPTTNPMVK